MSQDRDTNLALFIDFDNVALGARDARQRFDVKLLLQRVLEKGKIIVKRAYADWHHYKEHMLPLHEAAIELIEIPMPRISGKNSADIKLVVDAMDLCYSKDHIDTFVIVSGDSDFSPLVSKLRENNKRVIGIGVKNSSSKLLINNCDEFMFYDDIYRNAVGQMTRSVTNVPTEKRDLFDFLVTTAQSLLQESRGVLYSSLIKDTMTRKQPDFNEHNYGYSNFGELLEEARRLGLLIVERDARAGGTWVVQGLGEGTAGETSSAPTVAPTGNGTSRSSRRRRGRGRGKSADADRTAQDKVPEEKVASDSGESKDQPVKTDQGGREKEKPARETPSPKTGKAQGASKETSPEKGSGDKVSGKADGQTKAPAKKPRGKKVSTKKAPTKKAPTKKVPTKTAPTKASQTKKATKKAITKKTIPTEGSAAKKTNAKQGQARKAVTKKSPATNKVTKKAARKTTKKATKKATGKGPK